MTIYPIHFKQVDHRTKNPVPFPLDMILFFIHNYRGSHLTQKGHPMKKAGLLLLLACCATMGGGEPLPPEMAWPVRAVLDEAGEKGLDKAGQWTPEHRGLENSGNGFEALYPAQYSALKEVRMKATFRFREKRGKAGLRIVEHVGLPDKGYYFLLDGETGLFTALTGNRGKQNGWEPGRIFLEVKLPPAEVNTIEVTSNSDRAAVSVNGKELWHGGAPLPTVFHSGFVALDSPVAITSLEIAGGGRRGGILAFGDSITHHCRWQDEAAKLAHVEIGNGGMACDDTVGAAKRLDTDVIALRPELVLILLGTNNASPTRAMEDLKTIAGRLRAEKIPVILCTVLPRKPLPQRAVELNKLLRRYCSEENIPLHDWYSVMDNGDGTMKPEYGGEVHPNAAGIAAMAKDFLADPAVKSYFPPKQQ